MKLNIIKKLLIIMSFIMLIGAIFSVKSFAVSQMIHDADEFLTKGEHVTEVINTTNLKETSNTFYRAFTIVALATAAIVGVSIGIKYIYESAEGQAKLKEAFVPYIFGCIIAFGAFSIWKIVIDFGNQHDLFREDYTDSETEEKYGDSYREIVDKVHYQVDHSGSGGTPYRLGFN